MDVSSDVTHLTDDDFVFVIGLVTVVTLFAIRTFPFGLSFAEGLLYETCIEWRVMAFIMVSALTVRALQHILICLQINCESTLYALIWPQSRLSRDSWLLGFWFGHRRCLGRSRSRKHFVQELSNSLLFLGKTCFSDKTTNIIL